jgi:TatD DNase family protein
VQIAVTYTANEFHGIYRGKKQHDEDFEEVLTRAEMVGCSKVVLTTMTLTGAHQNIEICKQYPNKCYMTLGIHPYHAADLYNGTSRVEDLVRFGRSILDKNKSSLVAFGEIGLDYFYLDRASKELQQKAFLDQLEVATQFNLPLFLHVRDSYEDFVTLIKPFIPRLPKGGVVHSFAGTTEEMLGLVELGFHISVNGVSFKAEPQLEMVRAIPMHRLQLETDAPWCELSSNGLITEYLKDAPPVPPGRKPSKFVRGETVKGRNESCFINRVACVVAGVKGVSLEEVATASWRNSIELFRLDDTK